MKQITEQQKKFADFFIETGNATMSYIRAGYVARGNAAEANASRLLRNAKVADYVEQRNQELAQKRIADIAEVKEFWTRIMRSSDEETKDRLKASEFIAKTNGVFVTKLEHSGDADNPIQHNIEGNINLVLNELEQLTDDEIDDIIASTTEEIGAAE